MEPRGTGRTASRLDFQHSCRYADRLMTIAALIIALLVGALGSLLATFMSGSAQDLSVAVLTKIFGWVPIRKSLNLTGVWRTTWKVESDAYPPEVTDDETKIRQFASRVYGTFEDVGSSYYVVGRIESDRVVTGTWHDGRRGGYHGTFQLVLDPATRGLEGQWIGFGKGGDVKNGEMIWVRKSHPVIRSA